jgi:hypothetical protein
MVTAEADLSQAWREVKHDVRKPQETDAAMRKMTAFGRVLANLYKPNPVR